MGKRPRRRGPYGRRFAVDGITLGRNRGHWVAEVADEGARRRVRLSANTEDEAKAELARFVEARRAVIRQAERPTIGRLWDLWLADRAADGLSNTIYAHNWVSMRQHFAARDPALLTADDCRAYARERFSAGRRPWTVHTELSRLRACLAWAVARKHIREAPYVWVPPQGPSRQRVLTVDEVRRLIEAAATGDPHVHLFVILAAQTGARHRAVLDLTWDRVDWDRGVIAYDELLPPDPMSKAWRKGRATVPIGRLARATLERAFAGRRTDHVIEHGGRRIQSIREGFARAVSRAGIAPPVTPHTLRHTVATWATERGVALQQIAQLLGHADSRTTELVYSHPSAERFLRKVVDAIDADLAGTSATVAEPKRDRSRRAD